MPLSSINGSINSTPLINNEFRLHEAVQWLPSNAALSLFYESSKLGANLTAGILLLAVAVAAKAVGHGISTLTNSHFEMPAVKPDQLCTDQLLELRRMMIASH